MRSLLALALAAVALAGCGGGEATKAGGSGGTVVLRMANTPAQLGYTPAVEYFVERAEELSGGNLRIEVVHGFGEFAADAEQQVVRAVASGEVDLGWSGTRVFDTLGVESFQALTAPMLIDSYDLEQAVIESGIPEEMLADLEQLGVVGLGVLGDGLRKPIAVEKPLLGPADWRGITFHAFRSEGQAGAIRALGATPTDDLAALDEGLATGRIQGFEKSLLVYATNVMESAAPYVTANVNLWPQMDVLLANPGRLAGLDEEQRAWLRQAAADAAARSVGFVDRDGEILANSCEAGARFANASEADLAALREAFVPVYAELERDAATRSYLERIRELAETTPAETQLAIPPGCTGPPPTLTPSGGAAPSELNGTYRWEITEEDALASPTEPKSPSHLATFPWIFTLTLEDGTWTLFLEWKGGAPYYEQPGASYSVEGDRITLTTGGVPLTFTFTVDEYGNLHVQPVQPMAAGEEFVMTTKPWTKIA
jgi:TRAP-type C4-dicarboxylate transport system substrate-binding protein